MPTHPAPYDSRYINSDVMERFSPWRGEGGHSLWYDARGEYLPCFLRLFRCEPSCFSNNDGVSRQYKPLFSTMELVQEISDLGCEKGQEWFRQQDSEVRLLGPFIVRNDSTSGNGSVCG